MPNQSLLYAGRVWAQTQLPQMMHIARELCGGQICITPDAATFAKPGAAPWLEKYYSITDEWQSDDRRKLLAFARDLLNSDYAGHRLTFQLFAQSPPFAHWPAVYRNFDFDGPLAMVKAAAELSDRVCRESHDTPAHPDVQHPRHLPGAEPRQRPVPGRRRRRHRLLRGQIGQDLDTSENVGVGDVPRRPNRRCPTSPRCSTRPTQAGRHRQGDGLPGGSALPRRPCTG